MDGQTDFPDLLTCPATMPGAAGLSVRDIAWGPADGLSLISGVSFDLKPGEFLGVVGPNGAGKSTLLRLIYRFYRPVRGEIRIDGRDMAKLSARELARLVAAVLQERPADFALTVSEAVALGRIPHCSGFAAQGAADREAVSWAVSLLELDGLENRQLSELSGGERQRVMLARALAQQPKILVLDEPTNHLDIRFRLKILNLLRNLGLTLVCSLHELNSALEFSDRVLVLSRGRMLACGHPDEALNAELVSAAFDVRASADRLEKCGRPQFSFSL